MTTLSFDDLPALYKSADILSGRSQKLYLRLISCEYVLLFICACMTAKPVKASYYYLAYTCLFSIALGCFVYRYVRKPEQVWYQARALAESTKTLTWRFAMSASPFDTNDVSAARRAFVGRLEEVLNANEFAGKNLPAEWGSEPQVTSEMVRIRGLSFAEKCDLYETDRIRSQRAWYAKKSGENRRRGTKWSIGCFITYGAAIASSAYRIGNPSLELAPTEPLIALAAGIVAWMQIKKFSELSSSYILTAHEIGLLHQRLDKNDEAAFPDFVSDAEQAFSREHTQWIARFEN